ncbi:MAG: gliding motility protein GldM [Spirosoma sp.]|nr:gliding motility protein GldM [Spirosoma sp.]
MAGTKETPRQKMIGMMYLVLTALLALQVTSAILDKFVLLNNSLEASTFSANRVNESTVGNIRATVEKSGNRPADVAIVQQADEVRKLTAGIISQIDGLKQRIITEAGGGLDELGNIKNLSEEEKVAQVMVGGNHNGQAYKLQKDLNGYLQSLTKYSPTKYPTLAADGKDDPISSRSPAQREKDFGELNFAQTPVPAALAVLTQRQTDVRRIEGEVLNVLAAKVGAQDVKFDKIIAQLSMDSKVVVAGTKFKGQMYLAASSSGIQPRMSLNGGNVTMRDGVGIVEFTAQGGAYDKDGLARRTLTGSISYNSAGGQKTVPLMAEYFVAKPTYQIETGTLPPLYLGCANKLSIQSPQLGALWNPTITANGGAVVPSGVKGKVTVVPSSKDIAINISNGGNLLGTERFRVNLVPRPTLEYAVGGRPANDPRGVPVSSARSVQVRAVADPSFAAFSPDDAKFRVTGMTVSLVRGSRRIQATQLGAGGGSIGGLAAEAQEGDRLVIQVDGVQRQNFRGEISSVPMGSPLYQVSLY